MCYTRYLGLNIGFCDTTIITNLQLKKKKKKSNEQNISRIRLIIILE